MKKFKKTTAIGLAVLIVGILSVSAFAATYSTPAEAVAGLTGSTVESVIAQRTESGKTYGTIASEAGKLEEFKAEMLELKKESLDERVAAGTLTQERADAILAALEANQANCDGTGGARIGRSMGAGFGSGAGSGMGNGAGSGLGRGQGGTGCGLGTCTGIGQNR